MLKRPSERMLASSRLETPDVKKKQGPRAKLGCLGPSVMEKGLRRGAVHYFFAIFRMALVETRKRTNATVSCLGLDQTICQLYPVCARPQTRRHGLAAPLTLPLPHHWSHQDPDLAPDSDRMWGPHCGGRKRRYRREGQDWNWALCGINAVCLVNFKPAKVPSSKFREYFV